MPIYAYKCASCGHAKDVLQKISDAALTKCPACGQDTFSKQLTAAGFQLKGSGWYVTDFRSGSGGTSAAATGADAASSEAGSSDSTAGSTASSSDTATASTPCGGSCACH